MGFGSRAMMAGGLGFAAAFAVACGASGNGLLSADQSSSIQSRLSAVSVAVDAHRCARASAAAQALNNAVSDLPAGVNQTLVRNLGQGAAAIQSLAARDCQASSTTTTQTTTSATSTATTVTQTVTSTPSTTTNSSTVATTTSTPATNTTPPGTSSSGTSTGGAPLTGQTKTGGGGQ